MEHYEPIHGRFERFCKARAFGTMDAKDLMHDTIVIALEKFSEFDPAASFLSFLCGIATRVLSNKRKKISETTLPDGYQAWKEQPGAEATLAVQELYAALAKLPEAMSESLILFEITGFSIKEIAQLQQCSEDAVKQRLARGRKQLAVLLSDEPLLMETR